MTWLHLIGRILPIALTLMTAVPIANSQDTDENPLATLALRPIGPALTSGRISDFAFHPEHKNEFYVATASGGLWKTDNNTITWQPLFDDEASYAIGVVELAPSDPKIVWVGTGENNAQRSVAYGDGVYKSIDGGNSWQNMGLPDSGHISQIWIHPEDANHVLVASQGPLWSEGGDRGLYRTRDGGQNWKRILNIDEHTGINEFVVDPRNFNNIVVSSYQRRRHVWVLINGGPSSGIHKTSDAGETWQEITSGLPEDHMGRIGLAGSASEPDILYAIIEANDDEKGVYRSLDFGNNWEKRSSYLASSPQYYNELIVDPHDADRLYSMDTFSHMSEDGGETFNKLSNQWRHVDDHALWIDPDNTRHLYIGGDGGIYESWDRGQTWRHVRNLSLAQFYRIQPDNDTPYYNVCGGTQDNNSLCAPSRTQVVHGITNSDWTMILGGDGYKPQFDADDPNIIYTQWQYGNLYRYDRRTQERVTITPHPGSGEPGYKWNWNTPILVSPHDTRRIYYAAEYLFRSDDRGDTWRKVSPDLTRQIDRNKLEVMGRVWGVDTIAKNDSTSRYGAAIGLTESPVQEGILYVGTDDGVISVSENNGKSWRRMESFTGIPEMSLVEDLVASSHNADVAYAVFDNHKRGDYKPYVMKTIDRGRSWRMISGNLPTRGSAHTIAEDHINPNLLFVGTEFGVFFTQDGGTTWSQMKNNFPTIAVRDLEIQRRENDLVIGTFGRGVYILDDYSALRTSANNLKARQLFPVRDPWLYVVGDLWDNREKGSMGAEFFSAPNPSFGAVFTYYLEEALESRAKRRRSGEIKTEKSGGDTPYPSWNALREEDRETAPALYLLVRNSEGALVRQLPTELGAGLHRTAWDLRLPPADPISLEEVDAPYWVTPPAGPMVIPGEYTVRLAEVRDGEMHETGKVQTFNVKALENSPEITSDRRATQAFLIKTAELRRAVLSAVELTGELTSRMDFLRKAMVQTVDTRASDNAALQSIHLKLDDLDRALNGDSTLSSRNEPSPMSIASRVDAIYSPTVFTQAPIGTMLKDSYAIAASEFTDVLGSLKALVAEVQEFEARLEASGAPYTPGRMPQWRDNGDTP